MGQLDKTTAVVQQAIDQEYDGKPSVTHGWVDLSAPLVAARLDVSAGAIDFDYFNAGVEFQTGARYPDDPAVFGVQYNHEYMLGAGAVLRPHFHWLQRQAAVPNMLLGYKLTSNGTLTTFETDWSNYTFAIPTTSVWTWATGCLPNITKFPEIDLSSVGISAMIDMVIWRDYTNASGLFAGADPVASDVTIKFYDGHVKIDQPRGSVGEYEKWPS